MKKFFTLAFIMIAVGCNPRLASGLRKNDLKRDVEMMTDKGVMVIRLSDSTPLHRDNFLKLIKQRFYDSILFHRVIQYFMIQAGDPKSKGAGNAKMLGAGSIGYTIPAEFR